jgi:hypothetical protein
MLGGATPAERIGELSRMDLDQKQIEYLLPFLHHFVETGKVARARIWEARGVRKARDIAVKFPPSGCCLKEKRIRKK